MSEMRKAIEASWRAARSEADRYGGLYLNAAAAAGWALERADGDIDRAVSIVAEEWRRWDWWALPAQYLGNVLREEKPERFRAAGE